MSSEDEENISKPKSPRIRFLSLGSHFYINSTGQVEAVAALKPSYV